MNWLPLTSDEQITEIEKNSFSEPIVIFKHSTSCSISAMAKMRLESSWDFENLKPYYLDLIQFRSISNKIADHFNIHHESPQLILIQNGECIYDASHFDISTDELKETLSYHKIEL